ncbi:MAG: NADH-quinone oxidoreductase subunit N [Halieaceae bacterium]|jgi:NADH-quinone oxidoreductase subunit N|nr:NADH-quinone oxidoreductase subunit N [Halieaceae bacterium]MBT5006664.1 NADH-quinone oxidoreductase subunit N [Halieaceae bacterium]MBT6124635.1 NADH-quinone oxidoreductase subunit N [Halieaceae bacterium]MBT7720547.1 NADH-quinone oxidoreductase subunit N [Halieaceae bacterium]
MNEFVAIAPLLMLALGATAVMLQIAFLRSVRLTAVVATVSLLLASASCFYANDTAPLQVGALLQADTYSLLFCILFTLAGAVTCVLSLDYIQHHGDEPEEYFLLLILATLGACVLAYAVHLASLLLGLELLSVSLYALIAYPNRSLLPLEAAIKYLVLSGAASATLLFGFALLYATTGTLHFSELGTALEQSDMGAALPMAGAAMILAGLAFKLSAVPFHLWTPDVYDGAPAPISGFLASVGKAAVFVVLLRLFLEANLFRYERLVELTGLMAILSMLAGNLLALQQTNIKRMLAYSSIAHIGYLLIVFMVCLDLSNRDIAIEAAAFYLIAYTATTLAAFGLLTLINEKRVEREQVQLQHVSGLFWRQPMLAGLMLVALLSLAGIPLTAGFIGKFYIFSAAVSGSNWILLAALIIGSGISIYYYLRVVFYMTKHAEEHKDAIELSPGWSGKALSCLLIASILVLGIMPQSLIAVLGSIL